MSRNKGTFNFSANFEPLLKAPLDARQVVGTFADLTDPSTWKDADELVWLYNGLIVGVGNDADPSLNGAYFLKDADNYTNALSWSKLGGGDGKDGNANVTMIKLLADDITWQEGIYMSKPANTFSIENEAVNRDIIDHGAVLGYCRMRGIWYQLPHFVLDESYYEHIVHTFSLNTITLFAYNIEGVYDPSLVSEYRFLLITDNTITTKLAAKGTI